MSQHIEIASMTSGMPDGSGHALARLKRLVPLSDADLHAIAIRIGHRRTVRVRRELLREGQEMTETGLIVSGWAARSRLLPDGRRQFLSFLLPGDMIGLQTHARPLALCTVVALTELEVATMPPAATSTTLAEAYALAHALEEAHLLAQIIRLGRLNAQQRIGDLLLELLERSQLAALASHSSFDLPLTQEVLADATGLTPVHVNRMLQLMRREGDLRLKGGRVTLTDPDALARKVGHVPVRVSATHQ